MVEPELVRAAMRRVTQSPAFTNAARSQRFLTWVVEQTLAGQTDSIKEVVLGIEVFDRPAGFDPRADTIVRVEAGKLRKRLREYYETDGATDPLRIEIPKGAYVPEFHPAQGRQSSDRRSLSPSILPSHWPRLRSSALQFRSGSAKLRRIPKFRPSSCFRWSI